MRSPSSLFVRRVIAGGLGVITTAALTFAGVTTAEAADTSCRSGYCTVSFDFTGASQTWTVPDGVKSITAQVLAGSGGQATFSDRVYPAEGGVAGLGGAVRATVPVTPGYELSVIVGGAGEDGVADYSMGPARGGFGGGASAGAKGSAGPYGAGGGGGGSFLFDEETLLLAAGGGGGASVANAAAVPGGSGGSTGDGSFGGDQNGDDPSYAYSGKGATTSKPGVGGSGTYSGQPGSSTPASGPSAYGTGGVGAVNPSDSYSSGGAGGGGGFYGGGGGAVVVGESSTQAGSGGGGSGFVAATATEIDTLSGNSGNGKIVLTYEDPSYATTTTLKASDTPNDATPTTLTAVISPSEATGTVTFKDADTDLGTATLTDGTATLSKVLSAGTHTITASYSGDSSHNPSQASITVTVTAYTAPSFSTSSTTADPIEKTALAGEAFSFTDLAATGTPTPTHTVEDDDSDSTVLPDGVTFTDGVLAGRSTLAGTWQIKITATNSVGTSTEYVKLTIAPGTATGLEATVFPGDATSTTSWAVAPDGTVTESAQGTTTNDATITADQGGTIAFQTTPVDQYGNAVTQKSVKPETLSSVDTDTITYDTETNLTTVLFNHASPHVITITVNGVTNSFTVQVTPTPRTDTGAGTDTSTGTSTTGTSTGTSGAAITSSHLPITGSAPLAPLGWALVILTAGLAVILLHRHRTARRNN